MKTEFSYKWNFLIKKFACPYDFLNCLDEYQKPINNLRKIDFFSIMIKDFPIDNEIERRKKILNYSIP